ncbi:MAG: type I glutamate--ammonia ligase [Dehalococcoidia bacterium]|jgi:glutamine synthetase
MTPEKILKKVKDENIKFIDLKFLDLPGLWQHFTITPGEIGIDDPDGAKGGIWTEGIGFDGSSIRGFQEIQESDMILKLDAETAVIDPICEHPTLSVICDVYDPVTGKPYSRDPRYIAKKAAQHLKSTGIADTCYCGPEAEFFIFDDVRFDQDHKSGFYFIDSVEADWNSGKDEKPNLAYKPRYKEGYFPVPPTDSLQDLRSEIVEVMASVGLEIEVHHHEVATAGQCEIDMKYKDLLKMADQMLWFKYVIKNVCRKHNRVATFMPKPLFQDNGSGMHVHQSLFKDGKNVFFDAKGYALISQTCKYYIGGLLKHAEALCAICAPSTNSYKRLVPGFEAPVNLVYSARNRSAAVRIPMYSDNPKAKRIEFRPPDSTCNGYLALSALLMAGLDGIANKIDPGQPFDKDTYTLSAREAKKLKTVPGSLEQAINALEKDHKFLLTGGVFTQDVIDTWINYKRTKEIDEVRLRPHPHEFYLYFDI